jgi:hypothetical protein
MFEAKGKYPRPITHSPNPLRAPFRIEDSHEEESQTPVGAVLDRPTDLKSPSSRRILRLELFVLAAIIGFAFFARRTMTQEDSLEEFSLSQTRSLQNLALSVAAGNTKVTGLAKSIEAVTASLAQSSSKIGEFSDQLGQRQNEMQDFYARLHRVEIAMRKSQEVSPPLTHTIAPLAMGHGTMTSTSPTASPSNPRTHEFDLSIPLPDGSVAHHNSQGETDYWMVPRVLPSGEHYVKVEPYGTTSLGVKVHNMEDGREYILTPQGGWTESLEP